MVGEITTVVGVSLVVTLVKVTVVPFERKIIPRLLTLAEHNMQQESVTTADCDSATVSYETFFLVLLQSPFSQLISLHGGWVFPRTCPTVWTYFAGMTLGYQHEDCLVHLQTVLKLIELTHFR